jgi:nucleotide-binding universal stress UspA family protein
VSGPLIIGFEGTLQGRDALVLGRRLAAVADAKPLVAAVFTWPHGVKTNGEIENVLDTESRGLFDRAFTGVGEMGTDVRAIADRSVAKALTELAEVEEAIAIVVGSAGRGSIGRTLMGSTADALLNGAPCAVAVAPRGYSEERAGELRRIAVAYDGSSEADVALRAGAGLAARIGGELTLIGVTDPGYGYAGEWSALTVGAFREFELDAREEALRAAEERLTGVVEVNTRLLAGPVGRMLADASGGFDLMLSGSRGYGPVLRTLLGSAIRGLVAEASCPVMILPREAEAMPFGEAVLPQRRSGKRRTMPARSHQRPRPR